MDRLRPGDKVTSPILNGIGTVKAPGEYTGYWADFQGVVSHFHSDELDLVEVGSKSSELYGYFIVVSETSAGKPQRFSKVFRDGYHAVEHAKKLASDVPNTKFRVFKAYTAFEAVSKVSEVPL